MLPCEYRLKHEKDIKALFARGKSVFDIGIGMKFKPNRLEQTRFAVVVGSKVSKKAVERNRLKRQMRAVIHEQLSNIKPGFDVIFFAKKEVLGIDFSEIQKQILTSLRKAKIL